MVTLRLALLESLDLSGNGISRLPEDISACRSLKFLWLNGNRLRRLPRGLTKLRRLQLLNLSDNCLLALPITAFASRPRIVCCDNPALSYLPYSQLSEPYKLGMAPHAELECDGCFKDDRAKGEKVDGFQRMTSSRTGIEHWLDQTWSLGDFEMPSPPSLLELCMRAVEASGLNRFDDLPSTVAAALAEGPICTCQVCGLAMFGLVYVAFDTCTIDPNPLSGQRNRMMQVDVLKAFCSQRCKDKNRNIIV